MLDYWNFSKLLKVHWPYFKSYILSYQEFQQIKIEIYFSILFERYYGIPGLFHGRFLFPKLLKSLQETTRIFYHTNAPNNLLFPSS